MFPSLIFCEIDMRLAAKSQQKIEQFFQQFFEDAGLQLPLFQIHCGFWSNLLTKTFRISGITLGKHIFISPAFVGRDEFGKLIADFDLIVHETTHVLQYHKQGFWHFLFSYVREWVVFIRRQGRRDIETRWQAYYATPHEKEARAATIAYAKWKSEIKSEA